MELITKLQTVVFDARCLQDPDYAPRGVGRHALGLLKGRERLGSRLRLVGLIDPALPPLSEDARSEFDELCPNAYATGQHYGRDGGLAAFVSLSPMTHDPLFCARLLTDRRLLRVAVVYDFIPHRYPDLYLSGAGDKLNYAMQLHWLASCDLFFPISGSASADLVALLSVQTSAVTVTGAALNSAFERVGQQKVAGKPMILVVGGGDARKDPSTVIRAHANSALLQQNEVPLVVAGNYGPTQADELRATFSSLGGRPNLLTIPGHLPQDALLSLYSQATVLVAPSKDEGFSLPVVEGMAAGAVVLTSDIPAHAELVTDAARRFPIGDDRTLSPLLERAVTKKAWRQKALRAQAEVWPRFLEAQVAARFWKPILHRLNRAKTNDFITAPVVLRRRRPRIAILSPLPPDRSGVADYTAATCSELGKLVELHVFTETVRPSPILGAATIRPLDALPLLTSNFDRVLGVLGNSHFHQRIFELMERYGGGAIAHDARMLGFYRVLLGQKRALSQASLELGRPVTDSELNVWLGDENKLEALFLGEIAASAAPMVVHSRVTASLVRERHGVTPVYLPFSIYRPWLPEELTPANRTAARARLGLPEGEKVIASFGYVQTSKGPEECIWALDFLRAWGVNASLHFVGGSEHMYNNGERLNDLASSLGLKDHVHILGNFVTEQVYKDYLAGADLGIQLRNYRLGGLSGALLDCAAAGLPCVTNESLAQTVGVPAGYTRSIPDVLNPILLAEACGELIDLGITATRCEEERQAFSEARSFKVYARELCKALQLDVDLT